MPDATIHTSAILLEHLGGILYQAELINGKKILAHLSKPLTDAGATFEIGDKVVLELTPYDFEQGRLIHKFEEES